MPQHYIEPWSLTFRVSVITDRTPRITDRRHININFKQNASKQVKDNGFKWAGTIVPQIVMAVLNKFSSVHWPVWSGENSF